MRNSIFWRNVAIGFVVAGALTLGFLARFADTVSNGVAAGLASFGLMSVLFGGIAAIFRHRESRAASALARGEELLAQWRVDTHDWAEFLAFDATLRDAGDSRPNELSVRAEVPDDGVAVRVGRTVVTVDESVHMLPTRGNPEIQSAALHDSRVRPSYIELELKYVGGGAGASGAPRRPVYVALRFPVPRAAIANARTVVAHFNGDLAATPDVFHGRGDGSDAEDLSRCWSCGFETHKFRSECPKCGSSLQSRRWSRRFGFMLTLCGLFLTVAMGGILYVVWPMLSHPGTAVNGTSFSGSAAQAAMVFTVLAAVFAFGATALGYGAWQMRTGRRNRRVAVVMLAVVFALVALARWL